MKILFVSGGESPDYQCDMLLHGLRHRLGNDTVDVERSWYMYKKDVNVEQADRPKLYGCGFTVFGTLPDDGEVDRSDIAVKISRRYFDLVVYASIWRCRDYLDEVLSVYPAKSVAFIDGEDHTDLYRSLVGRGVYFKRELLDFYPRIRPITFAIPAEKIGTVPTLKDRTNAYIDPSRRWTYIYKDETSYYGDYARSLFGKTRKKGGWDCLRHYEILANKCMPDFYNIDKCPVSTMVHFPKYEMLRIQQLIKQKGYRWFESAEGREKWTSIFDSAEKIFMKHCTTLALADYFLETMSDPNQNYAYTPAINTGQA
jgi:hypothetical protein